MKSIGILLSVVLCATQAHSGSVAAGHIPIAHQHPYDDPPYNSICWGFAQGRAFGKEVGDPDCDPAKTYIDRIDETRFPFVAGSALTGIKYGDIVVFGNAPRSGLNGHAAFVISVPNPLTSQNRGEIRVDQVPYENANPEYNKKLSEVITIQGEPVGYHKGLGGQGGNTVRLTFKNSFGGGNIVVGPDQCGDLNEIPSGYSKVYYVGATVTMKAIDNQVYQGIRRRYKRWRDNTNAPIQRDVTVLSDATYEAVFLKEFDITFRNQFTGVSGNPVLSK